MFITNSLKYHKILERLLRNEGSDKMEEVFVNNQLLYPSDFELYLFHEGTLYESYKMLGAHPYKLRGKSGFRFAVWAPNAQRVSIVGDFNQWNGQANPMARVPQSGIWVGFVSGIKDGALYKYEIESPQNERFLKSDPYGFYSEKRPKTASVIHSFNQYEWKDHSWMSKRDKLESYDQPMLIYELHLGTWKIKEDGTFYTYREIASELVEYIKTNGFTHIEFMPIMEHPFDRSWGYQITGYYSVTSRYGSPEDFMYLIDLCHQNDIGVILDWVPVHFCKDAHGLGKFDGTPLYEPINPLLAERPNWGTYNFDFSKPEVVSFLISNIMFWLDVYHVDGFRVDAVSSMIYLNHDNALSVTLTNEQGGVENLSAISFLKKLNEAVFTQYPNILMIAEEATDFPLVSHPTDANGLGFNYKWNMGWANDILRYMQYDMRERHYHHNLLTFSIMYTYSENFVLPFSHDEVVYGKRSLLNKMPGDYWQKFANLRLLYGYFLTHPGKKLLFMGSEFAQFDEWKDLTELDWDLLSYDSHQQFLNYTKTMNQFYNDSYFLWRLDFNHDGFEWIDANNAKDSVINFIRRGKRKGDYCIVICNFSSNTYNQYRVGVPSYGRYFEVMNSDDIRFGGSGQCNREAISIDKVPYHNQPYSMEVKIPPLGIIIFMKETKKRRR